MIKPQKTSLGFRKATAARQGPTKSLCFFRDLFYIHSRRKDIRKLGNGLMKFSTRHKLLLAAGLAGIILIGYAAVNREVIVQTISLVNENTPAPLFIALMIILPIFGVPISLFLLVLGIKFGLAAGLALMVIIMPIHMIISFALTKVAGDLIRAVLSRGSYIIPQIPADKQIRFSFLVSAVPLLPYAAKNFLMPLAGVPFRLYLGMNWACQAMLAVPTVVLGSSIADLNPGLFVAAIAGLIVVYLAVSRIEKRYGKHVDFKSERDNGVTAESRPQKAHRRRE